MSAHKLSFAEKAGYSAGDSAANFVFMSMILFQLNVYTDVFALSAGAAAAILLWPRLWDAAFDPVMGVLADRTRTRWGRFRPWVLWTSIPWAIVMIAAYTVPSGLSGTSLTLYAALTNMLLMTLYSMNNMPYSALGGVMTADLNERARLNSFRFVSVNIAQFIVGGFTLPLVARFAEGHDRAYGWRMTMTVWAVVCLVLFLITFFTTRERVQPIQEVKSTPREDFRDLLKNRPWRMMALMTLFHFGLLSFRGGAMYNYFHYYADKAAMFGWLQSAGFTINAGETPNSILELLGYVVHPDRSNVADVFNSLVNMLTTGITIVIILVTAGFAKRFGKKETSVAAFGLSALATFAIYALRPDQVNLMVLLPVLGAVTYAPAIPLIWAIYADVADFSELQIGRRFTGMVFATIGFMLKAGLALGSASFLWLMSGLFNYDTKQPDAPSAVGGYAFAWGIGVGTLFAICTLLLWVYELNQKKTIDMANELDARRARKLASAS